MDKPNKNIRIVEELGFLLSSIRTVSSLVNSARTSQDEEVLLDMDHVIIKRSIDLIFELATRGELMINSYLSDNGSNSCIK